MNGIKAAVTVMLCIVGAIASWNVASEARRSGLHTRTITYKTVHEARTVYHPLPEKVNGETLYRAFVLTSDTPKTVAEVREGGYDPIKLLRFGVLCVLLLLFVLIALLTIFFSARDKYQRRNDASAKATQQNMDKLMAGVIGAVLGFAGASKLDSNSDLYSVPIATDAARIDRPPLSVEEYPVPRLSPDQPIGIPDDDQQPVPESDSKPNFDVPFDINFRQGSGGPPFTAPTNPPATRPSGASQAP